MILLQVEIKISKIFDKCKYWTNNRAFLGMDVHGFILLNT